MDKHISEIVSAYENGKLSLAEVKKLLKSAKKRLSGHLLSEGQKGLWALQKTFPDMTAYNIPICFRISCLNMELFRKAYLFLIKQYPVLRTVINEKHGIPRQIISHLREPIFQPEDLSGLESDQVEVYLNQQAKKKFDLQAGPLFRTHLFYTSSQETIVLMVVHHIIFDGTSVSILLQTLFEAYQTLAGGKEPIIRLLPATYDDFVANEQRILQDEEERFRLLYWKQQLVGNIPVLNLQTDRPRSLSQSFFNGKTYSHLLPVDLSAQIKQFAKSHKLYFSSVFMALFKTLLYKYTGENDLIVGMPVNERNQERFNHVIGFLINMIPVRSILSKQESFFSLANNVQKTIVNGLAHSYPFSALVRELNLSTMAENAPLFRVAFEYQDFLEGVDRQELPIRFVEGIHQEGEYEIVLELRAQQDGIALHWKYNPELFDKATIVRMKEHYLMLAQEAMAQPDLPLDTYTLLSDEEKKILLSDWNDTKTDYPQDKCVHRLFEVQAKTTPDSIAVSFKDRSLTYRELDQKSTALALYLQDQGVKPNTLVAVYMERSLEMPIGLLGILKASGAYVPLDPEYPKQRLSYILDDSRAGIILTQSQLKEQVSSLFTSRQPITETLLPEPLVIALDGEWSDIQALVTGNTSLLRNEQPDDLAYVLYTSGSTGNPKGVMIPHQALTNFLIAMSNRPGMKKDDKLLAVTTYCFDIAGLELFLPLITGAHCQICDARTSGDANLLKHLIAQIKPTVMQATPSTWKMLFHAGWQNKENLKILCGGETLPDSLKQHFVNTDSEAWNLFGPTETTIWSTVDPIKNNLPITIGKPIANTRVYILDRQNQPAPMGIPGELCIAGDGLAKGYLNKPDLTAETFISNPFHPQSKLYRTGDLARWRADGKLEHLGRLDFQVKVHGFRIELGDIETQLNHHPYILESIAVIKEQEASKQLIAYYLPDRKIAGNEPDLSQQLKSYLKSRLPAYMIPAFFVPLQQIPMTPNGKIDRKALMGRSIRLRKDPEKNFPQSELEQDVLKIWQDVLRIEDISVTDGFFEAGGNSVSAVILAERINQTYGIDFPVRHLFNYANVQQISQYLNETLKPDRDSSHQATSPKPSADQQPAVSIVDESTGSSDFPDYYRNSLAIIGISCHFPGARHYGEFWQNLKDGRESARFFTKEELRNTHVPEQKLQNPNYVPIQLGIEGKDLFDPSFFNLSSRNADFMDPQFRMLLLHSWKAVEDAGYVSHKIPETGVYISVSNSYYQALLKNSGLVEESDEYVAWLLAQGGTIPTQISYQLGLNGPSVFIHSNCSSALVALSSACQSLRLGEIKTALIGASTLFPASSIGYVYQPGLNFSSDGHCRAFDASADGMTPGEGVSAILVKKAPDAIRDGDHIYALLRGIGINNDGSDKAGFYAPSIKGQSDVIRKVLDTTAINPESIGYIEAHGTGTKLGDPIELQALTNVYQKHTSQKQFCAIGSVKSNIGHLDTGAGLAGLIKVALSLLNKEIPPSINYTEPNPEIDFEQSPFYVNDRLLTWPDGSTPRRAALSSFGIGGTNAHAVLEEYQSKAIDKPPLLQPIADQKRFLIPLSAKNEDRLLTYAQDLLAFLQKTQSNGIGLEELSYTLQVGRKAMESRVIFIVSHRDELIEKLNDFTVRQETPTDCYQGKISKTKGKAALFRNDEDSQELIAKWIAKGKLRNLAQLWTTGGHVNWKLFYQDSRPQRVSLPTYPFAREKHGIAEMKSNASMPKSVTITHSHPLVQTNTSDLFEHRFSSLFTGDEFFLKDHQVTRKKVMPAVGYLEMAHEAVKQAAGVLLQERQTIRLKNIVWSRPLQVKHPQEVFIRLFPKSNGEIAFNISTNNPDPGDPLLVHSQGVAGLASSKRPRPLRLDDLRTPLIRQDLDSQTCYQAFNAVGFDYGPSLRGLETIYTGSNEVLAKLKLPSSVAATRDRFTLHPSLADAALQASIGIDFKAAETGSGVMDNSLRPALPFAMDSIHIFEPCVERMWAWVRLSRHSGADTTTIRKLDIDLCDDAGKICVTMRGLTSRLLAGETSPTLKTVNTLLARPVWKEKPVASRQSNTKYLDHRVFLGDLDQDMDLLQGRMPGITFSELEPNEPSALSKPATLRFAAAAQQVIADLQQLLKQKPLEPILIQVLVPDHDPAHPFSALSGLLKTARLENPHLLGQVISVQKTDSADDLITKLQENSRSPQDHRIRYRDQKRQVASFTEITGLKPDMALPWQEGGVYLITGGAGGLGLIFAREISQALNHANLILTGRSALSPEKQTRLRELEHTGFTIDYQQTDATDLAAVKTLIQAIQTNHGRLNGVIHGAGVIRDNYIIKKTAAEFAQVLAPKVTGTINLDLATQELALDFFVLFSSVSGVLGNVGQIDYAAANAFMDEFANLRNALRKTGQRRGQTLSISWPLWEAGGMTINETGKQILDKQTGLRAMETSAGLKTFYQCLASNQSQVVVLAGEPEKIAGLLNREEQTISGPPDHAPEAKPIPQLGTVAGNDLLEEKTVAFLKRNLAEVLKVPIRKIQAEAPLESYGIDSIMVTRLTNELEKSFGSLSKTLFFEYQTLGELSRYFIKSHHARLATYLQPDTPVQTEAEPPAVTPPETAFAAKADQNRFKAMIQPNSGEPSSLDIAIIGLSGRYPQSPDLETYWQNLRDGRDCIREIPKERWDWRDYYTEDRTRTGGHYSKWGGFIDEVDCFDPLFFNISPREAILMDPQERLFLEHAWMALEDAGIRKEDLRKEELPQESADDMPAQVGVYAGVMYGDYQLYGAEESLRGNPTALGGSYATIANRVSYVLNLHGPSMTVDTMCSSSLTTLHLACQDLKNGRTNLGIAGGVNVSIHPAKYLSLSMGQFISSRGHCESFGEGGDGYIPGEGVGVALLKRLSEARRDKDHIYGIIKASAVNHGGKTNGYSVPNPRAQTAAIRMAMKEAGINPEMISYIEAHGTGTKLGDPIEIAGLNKAFGSVSEKQCCRIGSAKSNIGHCESAAGIAGVTKVLLQLQHGQIVPSLHSEVLNPNIDFTDTPFIVNQELRSWQPPVINGKTCPRIAGVSSFGAGGSNAHVLIEEYLPDREPAENRVPTPATPALVVLSARNRDRLKKYAENLLQFVNSKADSDPNINLPDLAYTLQVGREALEERLGLIVTSLETLKEKLRNFLDDRQDPEGVYHGQVKPNQETLGLLTADEDMTKTIAAWIQKRKYSKLLELWVKGLSIDWHQLYGEHKPQRISAPVYPFARIRYWVKTDNHRFLPHGNQKAGALHPLLQRNTSRLSEQRFSSVFSGDEFFLKGYRLQGQKTLPGLAFLEMAQQAFKHAVGELPQDNQGIRLKNVVWGRPITVDHSRQIHISLLAEKSGETVYEIYTTDRHSEQDSLVHCQGTAGVLPPANVLPLNLRELRLKTNQKKINAEAYDQTFQAPGSDIDPAHRHLEALYSGENEALAKLLLPASALEIKEQFNLYPGFLDAVLQASAVMDVDKYEPNEPLPASHSGVWLPYALERLDIIASCSESMWAWVRSNGSDPAGNDGTKGKTRNLDIDLCDDTGKVCIKIRGVTCRMVDESIPEKPKQVGTLLVRPVWKEKAGNSPVLSPHRDSARITDQRIFLCGLSRDIQNLQTRAPQLTLTDLESNGSTLAQRFESVSLHLFHSMQTILQEKPKTPVFVQVLVPEQGNRSSFAALSGLLKTAHLENPNVLGQMIAVKEEESAIDIIDKLQANSRFPDDQHIRYEGEKRLVASFEEMIETELKPLIPWKDGGVYLITGGLGGLGVIFSQEIAQRVNNATLILTGRSALDSAKQARLEELKRSGIGVEYRTANVADKRDVEALIHYVESEFGELSGIIHSAGVIKDNFMMKKTHAEFKQVLAPKVHGVVNLDQATKKSNLEFFILFSSGSAALGNAGQADYATANAFMDSFAAMRNARVDLKERSGRTLSINWPLWQEGGMELDEVTARIVKDRTGLLAMKTASGLKAFYHCLSSKQSQVMVLEGFPEKIRRQLLKDKPKPTSLVRQSSISQARNRPVASNILQEKTVQHLKRLFGEVINLSASEIDQTEPMESYGINSIMITQLNQKLEPVFGEFSKTLFFEYQTLADVAHHFTTHYPETCARWTDLEKQSSHILNMDSSGTSFDREWPQLSSLRNNRLHAGSLAGSGDNSRIDEPIAIIGVSGRYPQAANLEEYWENLKNGKNCIAEIPQDRWSLEGFFHPNKKEAIAQGKSYSKWGGFLEGASEFDPLFFNISPREAISMDPQERLFLQSCWELLEDAGYTKTDIALRYDNRVGVFAGITKTGYNLYGPDLWKQDEQVFPHTSFSSVANRVSYLMNFQGPSMPIDTMCSSSLTAMHEACEHLKQSECDLAIAGGVNLYLHPSAYVVLCAQHMLSTDGQCKSFGKGGDGFVPGEGVGTVLLKALSRAVEDRDHIYAVIRATGVNHGGKTNGYTVPNPRSQADLIGKTMRKAGIDARLVSYVEAHGTGTELGDPIEIAGLTRAFQHDAMPPAGYCAVGSVKSNIGHLEAAAGIAGVTKIILQMKYKTLVRSLHSAEVNANIDFAGTPFVINQEAQDWQNSILDGKAYPRIAGISSFGAGGSNAHAIIEEYIPTKTGGKNRVPAPSDPGLIVLSARDQDRLHHYAVNLLQFMNRNDPSDQAINMSDLAYTLQVGREPLEVRLGLMASSFGDLKEKLQAFVNGQKEINDLYSGQVSQHKETIAVFNSDEDMTEIVETWVRKKKYNQLLKLWVKGLSFDWNKLYQTTKPRRISAPTYPFSKDRYWVPSPDVKSDGALKAGITGHLHPLVQENTSKFSRQQFSSTFTGDEFFLNDHRVNDQKVLPGVAYLEMAREAVKRSVADLSLNGRSVQLDNIVWTRPIPVNNPQQVHIGLYPEENGKIAYEIFTDKPDSKAEKIVHSQGLARFTRFEKPQPLNLDELQARLHHDGVSPAAYYEAFKVRGIDYGPAHQGMEKIHADRTEVLAKLKLPASVSETRGRFTLHPSLLDSALQASVGLDFNETEPDQYAKNGSLPPSLPFALERLDIIEPCSESMWAWIRLSDPANRKKTTNLQKLDIDLCDEMGGLCVKMRGFAFRRLEGSVPDKHDSIGNLIAKPVWKEKPVTPEQSVATFTDHHVFLCGIAQTIQELQAERPHVSFADLETHRAATRKASWSQRLEAVTIQLLATIQAILQAKPKSPILIQVLVPAQGPRFFSAVSGLLKTAHLENPNLVGQVIAVSNEENCENVISKLHENKQSPRDQQISYQAEARLVASFEELTELAATQTIPWKEDGLYLITGGAGGLGFIFAREISRQVHQATVILTGRSTLNEKQKTELKRLEGIGARIIYMQVDVADSAAVQALIEKIQTRFGSLNGMIHSAGVIQDNFIIKKTKAEIQQVMAPKVHGVFNLDYATRKLALDFFVLFSSGAGVTGNVGQADYATANLFMDEFADYRNRLTATGRRTGHTLSIDWPLWQEGGMNVDATTEKLMQQSSGLVAMRTETGIESFYQAIQSGHSRLLVMEGDLRRIRSALQLAPQTLNNEIAVSERQPQQISLRKSSTLKQDAMNYFKQLLSSSLKLPMQQIKETAPFETYGMDSISAMGMTNQLEKTFGTLPKTLFFEHPTILGLTHYFLETHGESLQEVLHDGALATSVTESIQPPLDTPLASTSDGNELADPAVGVPVTAAATEKPTNEFPLSHGQRSLWFLKQLAPESSAYNTGLAFRILSNIDAGSLKHAFQILVNRHPSLRTTFGSKNGEPFQRVRTYQEVSFVEHDVADLTAAELQIKVNKISNIPFDLMQGPLMRIHLFHKSETESVLLLSIFHIVNDFWSLSRLIPELWSIYSSIVLDEPYTLAPLNYEYRDFVSWQAGMLSSATGKKSGEYWLKQLRGNLPVLNLKCDHPRPKIQTSNGATHTYTLSKSISSQLEATAAQNHCTVNVVLLSAFQVLLHRYTGQSEFLIGIPMSGRTREEFADVCGYFVNPVVLKANVTNDIVFPGLLADVRESVLSAMDHQDYPMTLLVEKLKLNRSSNHPFLFQVLYNYIKAPTTIQPDQQQEKTELSAHRAGLDLDIEPYPVSEQEGQFDLTLSIMESSGIYACGFKYNSDLFRADTILRMGEHYQNLLNGIINHPTQKISDIPLLSKREYNQLIKKWNPQPDSEKEHLHVLSLFEDQVRSHPDSEAVSYYAPEDSLKRKTLNTLTYQALNDSVNQLARFIQKSGLQNGDTIGVCLERSLDLIVSVLAIWKVGGIYVPLDPNLPQKRIAYMIKDTKTSTILTHKKLEPQIPAKDVRLIRIDEDRNVIAQESIANPERRIDLKTMAYIIYTSGSTGIPKGVMVNHGSLSSLFSALAEVYQLGSQVNAYLQMANFSFDVFIGDLIRALCSGGKLILCPKQFLLEPAKLYSLIRLEKIEFAEFVPGIIRALIDYLETNALHPTSLKIVVVGSDTWHVTEYAKIKQYLGDPVRLINSYGVTEATIDNFVFETNRPASLQNTIMPIGRPLPNTRAYIVDRYLNPVPVGVVGELYLGGPCVSSGYLNREALMAERFVPDPFTDRSSDIMYKTGDLVRFLPDGTVEFFGRGDSQIKIRGFRVELGEIEMALLDHPHIKEAVVIAKQDTQKDIRLVAYVVSDRQDFNRSEAYTSYLKDKLPSYMIPSAFMILDELPLSSNGKVDKKALPEPKEIFSSSDSQAVLIPPNSRLERTMVELWSEALGIDVKSIGVNSNFFDLGGHSLKVTWLSSLLSKKLKIALPLNVIFERPVLSELVDYITNNKKEVRVVATYQPENLIMIRKGEVEGKNLFLVHAGSGEVSVYRDICRGLDSDISCWGIRARQLKNDTPINTSIKTIAEDYYRLLKEIQPTGPYNLAGWCIGGTIAFEIVRMMEQVNDSIDLLGMFNTWAPDTYFLENGDEDFTTESELNYIDTLFTNRELTDLLRETTSIHQIWPATKAFLLKNSQRDVVKNQIPKIIADAIPAINEQTISGLIVYLNVIRTLGKARANYFPRTKIATPLHYFSALENKVLNRTKWNAYLTHPMKEHDLMGDHFSFLAPPHVANNANIFNRILMNHFALKMN